MRVLADLSFLHLRREAVVFRPNSTIRRPHQSSINGCTEKANCNFEMGTIVSRFGFILDFFFEFVAPF